MFKEIAIRLLILLGLVVVAVFRAMSNILKRSNGRRLPQLVVL